MSNLHPERAAAQKAHNAARIAESKAETTTEAIWLVAHNACNATRKHLVAMEMKYPTYQEKRNDANRAYLASRGLLD